VRRNTAQIMLDSTSAAASRKLTQGTGALAAGAECPPAFLALTKMQLAIPFGTS
jgi:hypothetical protein